MIKTKAQRYNEKLNAIFDPEIKRLRRVEVISREVLISLNELGVVSKQGLESCYSINAISKVIGRFIK